MREIKELNLDAFKHLIQIPSRQVYKKHVIIFYLVMVLSFCLIGYGIIILSFATRFWSRSRFVPRPACDTVVNNMSEGFNSTIVDARSKPIITMMEEIRIYLMKRWASNRKKIATVEGPICPKIKSRLEKEIEKTKYWIPR